MLTARDVFQLSHSFLMVLDLGWTLEKCFKKDPTVYLRFTAFWHLVEPLPNSSFYWMPKCSCVLGMSLKLEAVRGDSHTPTRVIPWCICLIYRRGGSKSSGQFPEVKDIFHFDSFWKSVKTPCQVISTIQPDFLCLCQSVGVGKWCQSTSNCVF